jgi:hypothetical protein
MKTSTFLTKVLKKFNNGKNYTTTPFAYAGSDPTSKDFWRTKESKGHNNLLGMINKVADAEGFTSIQKFKVALANSLGHTSVDTFATSPSVKFSAVKAVLKAAIKRERANGN